MRSSIPAASFGASRASDSWFSWFAGEIARLSGRASAFLVAATVVILWGVTGPIFSYSDTWQLVINTGTTIVTFLMVFLIQHTQNRDTAALQLKLDELIIATQNARNSFAAIEEQSEASLNAAKEDIRTRAEGPPPAAEADARVVPAGGG